MKSKIIKIALYIQLILSVILLLLLILSDFGLILPSDNYFARTLLHFSTILLIFSAAIQLRTRKE